MGKRDLLHDSPRTDARISSIVTYAAWLACFSVSCTSVPPAPVFACFEHADCPKGQRCDAHTQLCVGSGKLATNTEPEARATENAAGERSSVPPTSAAAGMSGGDRDSAGVPATDAGGRGPVAGSSAADPPAAFAENGVARIGDACTAKGRGACAAVGSLQVLTCDGSRWVDDGQCNAGSVCGYTFGRLTRCAPIVAECRDQQEGSLVCVGSLSSRCNADLTKIEVVQDCIEPKETCQAGECVCNQPCGGACPNLMSDPKHCGECNRACAGQCSNGVCEPERLAATGAAPYSLTRDDNTLYWTEFVSGAVKKLTLADRTPATLATVKTAARLAVSPRGVYVNGEDGLFMVPLQGGSATMLLANSVEQGAYLATDGSWLYTANPSVTKLALTGGTPTVLATQQFANSFTVSAGYLFWTAFNGSVSKMSVSGGTPATIYRGPEDSVSNIAADTKYAYWCDHPRSAIVRVPIAGGSVSDFATDTTCNSIASDGKHVYWADNRNPGSVFRQAVDGTTATTVATNRRAYELTLDDENLYWLESNGNAEGVVMKLPK